jgi:hypothetical protein
MFCFIRIEIGDLIVPALPIVVAFSTFIFFVVRCLLLDFIALFFFARILILLLCCP